jgi:MFS transporter, DHA1 family, inner membrane transport protein
VLAREIEKRLRAVKHWLARAKTASGPRVATFKNKTFNLVYVHAALQALVMHGGEGFAFVYLLKAGIATWIVLACIAAMFASRLLFRMLVLPIALRFGLRNTLIASVAAEGATYLLLPLISDVGPLLYLYLATWAASSSFYWTTYHAYVAQIGNNEHRGQQVSAMEFFGMIAGVFAPLVMGFLLTWFNAWVGFGFIAAAMIFAALPFVFGPHIDVAPDAVVPAESRREAWRLMFTDGIRSAATHFVWLIALFITLSSSYVAYGGALALAGITGAFMGLVVGKWFDIGKGVHAARIGYGLMTASALFKCLGFHIPWSAVSANALNAVAWPSYATSLNSQVYNLARQSPCPLRFHIVAEGGWDMGMAIGCGFAALLVYSGFGFFWALAIGIAGCALGYFVLTHSMTLERA